MSPERRDAIVAFSLSLLLAVALTWPMAARLGSAGRVDSGDGRHGDHDEAADEGTYE